MRRLLIIAAALATTGPAPAADLAPATLTAGNSPEGLPPEEAARRALELCIDHGLGKAPFGPDAAQQLESKGFRLTGEKAPPGPKSQPGYILRATTTTGGVEIHAYTDGLCRIRARGAPAAPEALKALLLLERRDRSCCSMTPASDGFKPEPYSSPTGDGTLKWRWRRPGTDLDAFMLVPSPLPTAVVFVNIVPVIVGDPD